MSEILSRLSTVRAQFDAAVQAAGRDPSTVRLLAASKTRTPADVRVALSAGQCLFGENRAQELRDKGIALSDAPIEWHFIGSLQRNKVKYVVGRATMVHSVDSLSLAQALSERAARGGHPPVNVLIQVNIGREESKGGALPEATLDLAGAVDALSHVSVKGLMTIPPPVAAPAAAAPYFEAMVALAAQGRAAGLELRELSMGMSHDMAVAIAHGATIVRVGTAIFGPRR